MSFTSLEPRGPSPVFDSEIRLQKRFVILVVGSGGSDGAGFAAGGACNTPFNSLSNSARLSGELMRMNGVFRPLRSLTFWHS